MSSVQDCIVIGSGPAGYTAAIYAARSGMKVRQFQGNPPGGQLTITTDVENFPGFAEGIQGPELMTIMEQQTRRMGAEVLFDTVTKVDFSTTPFRVWDGEKKEHLAKTVIISTGSLARWLGLESEQRLNGHGVSACAVCDGFFFKNKEVSIVGGGDTACEEALYLANICTKVHMFVRGEAMRASSIMQKRVLQNKTIQVYFNTATEEVLGDEKVSGVKIKNRKNGDVSTIPVEAFFVAIGHDPNAALFKTYIETDQHGYIITKAHSAETNLPGVFAAGDVQDRKYKQAITAAGSGCMAALDAKRYLDAIED